MFNKLLLIVTDTASFDAVMRKIRLYGEDSIDVETFFTIEMLRKFLKYN